jgi:UDP-N-acetylmuramyl pentapeptide phosphotransferase/UDP-N-acetylglucosamine-1-phosphate transferase
LLLSCLLCVAIIAVLLRSKLAWQIATDIPNGRSLHAAPTPRIGGWGLVPAAIIAATVTGEASWYLSCLAIALFVLSYIDDRTSLPIYVRLPAQMAVAAAWLKFGPVSLPVHLAVMSGFAIVWATNFFNFMDGADGLAGGMAIVGFSAYGLVASWHGLMLLTGWSVAVAGASVGFLMFNFAPARVFLGDAGSVTVGFLAGAFGIWGWAAGAWPVWFPFLVAGPFFLDATVTIVRRAVRGEKFWKAHREHYYQRLIRSGWSHRRTAVFEYALMIVSASLAIAMLKWSPHAQYLALSIVVVLYGAIALAIDARWRAYRDTVAAPAVVDATVDSAESSLGFLRRPSTARIAESAHGGVIPDAPRPAPRRRTGNEEHVPEFLFQEPVLTREPDSVVQK